MKLSGFSLVLALASIGGCAGPIGFDIPKTIDEQRITGDPIANMAAQALPAGALSPQSITVDLAAESTTRRVPIGRVLVKSVQFGITATAESAPDTDDFSFVRSMKIYLECATASCTLPRVEVASITDPGAIRTMAFAVTPNVNVKPYIDQGARVVLEADAIPPPDDTTFSGSIVLRVEPF